MSAPFIAAFARPGCPVFAAGGRCVPVCGGGAVWRTAGSRGCLAMVAVC